MEEKFEMDSAGSIEQSKDLKTKLTKVNEHINIARKRYAIGEISSEVYDPTIQELNKEKEGLENALAESQIYLSNPSKQIQSIVEKVANLKELWVFSDLQSKHDLQKLIFPEGIQYDRKIDHYRTLAVDEIVKLIDSFSTELDTKRNDRPKKFIDLSPSVAPIGIELSEHTAENQSLINPPVNRSPRKSQIQFESICSLFKDLIRY